MKEAYRDIMERLIQSLDAPASEWIKPWEDAPASYPDVIRETPRIDAILDRYYKAEGIKYFENEGGNSFYAPEVDAVFLPAKKQFRSMEAYSAVKAHESIHSAGDYTRCNRPTFNEFTSFRFGDSKYSREELVAELGACFLLDALEIDTMDAERNAGAYIRNWLGQLNNNIKWVYKAGELAEEAVEYILETAGEEAGI